jgi:ribosomal protein L37AE/L43A
MKEPTIDWEEICGRFQAYPQMVTEIKQLKEKDRQIREALQRLYRCPMCNSMCGILNQGTTSTWGCPEYNCDHRSQGKLYEFIEVVEKTMDFSYSQPQPEAQNEKP